MIPAIVHLCWFGKGQKSDVILHCEATIKRMLSHYELMIWDDSNVPNLPFVEECYTFKRWALLADYIRLYALRKYGGIYLDMDIEMKKVFDPLLRYSCVLGFELAKLENRCIGNAVIMAEPAHPFIEKCLRLFTASLFTKIKPIYGVKIGNMVAFEYGLFRYGEQDVGGIHLMPKEAFYPDKDEVNADTYCIHHLEGSWHKKRGIQSQIESWKYKWHRTKQKIVRHFCFADVQTAFSTISPRKFSQTTCRKTVKINQWISEKML